MATPTNIIIQLKLYVSPALSDTIQLHQMRSHIKAKYLPLKPR